MSAATASANPILSINLAPTTVNVGETVTLTIDIENVADLYLYSFELAYNPYFLSFDGIIEGSFPQNDPLVLFTDFIPGTEPCFPSCSADPDDPQYPTGTVGGTGSTIITVDGTGVSGSGTLAIATFLAIRAGSSSISLHEELFFNSGFAYDPVTFLISGQISFSAINRSADVNGVASAVPDEPSAMIFLVAGLALAACRCFTRAL